MEITMSSCPICDIHWKGSTPCTPEVVFQLLGSVDALQHDRAVWIARDARSICPQEVAVEPCITPNLPLPYTFPVIIKVRACEPAPVSDREH
eukprot:UN1632